MSFKGVCGRLQVRVAGVLLFALGAPAIVALSGVPLLVVGLVWLAVGPIRRVLDNE